MYSDETVENAWTRARARCEFERGSDAHPHRCSAPLVWDHRGEAMTGGWEALQNGHKNLGGWEAVKRCQILCWACYEEITATATKRGAHGI